MGCLCGCRGRRPLIGEVAEARLDVVPLPGMHWVEPIETDAHDLTIAAVAALSDRIRAPYGNGPPTRLGASPVMAILVLIL
jgi:hypothetical protein